MLTIGQQFWLVPRNMLDGQPRIGTVTKVGRTWATLGQDGRADIETMRADGSRCAPAGYCAPSCEAWEEERVTAAAWRHLWRRMDHLDPPPGVTVDRIGGAAKLLGLAGDEKDAPPKTTTRRPPPMRDLAMCGDTTCPSRAMCRRNPASGNTTHHWQAWMEFRRDERDERSAELWPVKGGALTSGEG